MTHCASRLKKNKTQNKRERKPTSLPGEFFWLLLSEKQNDDNNNNNNKNRCTTTGKKNNLQQSIKATSIQLTLPWSKLCYLRGQNQQLLISSQNGTDVIWFLMSPGFVIGYANVAAQIQKPEISPILTKLVYLLPQERRKNKEINAGCKGITAVSPASD